MALALHACDPPRATEDAVTATIGPEGGTLALADGTSIEIPAAALSSQVEIRLSRAPSPPPLPEGMRALGDAYTLSPQGTTFATPAIVIVAYAAQVPGDEPVIMTAPSGTSLYTALASEPLGPGHLRALTTHLSDYVVASKSPCPGKGACTDGDACTFGDRCARGVCVGTRYACDDGDTCTTDTCDGAGGCILVANTNPCDDGDPCTHGDACSTEGCAGIPYGCDDGNLCTTDSCDGAGGCARVNNTASCDDGDACTSSDGCSGGSCGGIPVPSCGGCACDDGDECTTDTCDAAGSCVFTHNANYCDDGDLCTVSERCAEGVCQGGFACASCMNCQSGPCPDQYVCDITTECCVLHCGNGLWDGGEGDVDCGMVCGNYCAPGQHCLVPWDCASGVCTGGICRPCSCFDGNVCTTDTCDASGACVFTPNTGLCFDGDTCTENDRCSDGECHGTPIAGCAGCGLASCYADYCGPGMLCEPVSACCYWHCTDGERSGDEGDVDCGGFCDARCPDGSTCYGNWDCASGNCVAGICAP